MSRCLILCTGLQNSRHSICTTLFLMLWKFVFMIRKPSDEVWFYDCGIFHICEEDVNEGPGLIAEPSEIFDVDDESYVWKVDWKIEEKKFGMPQFGRCFDGFIYDCRYIHVLNMSQLIIFGTCSTSLLPCYRPISYLTRIFWGSWAWILF